MLYQISNLPLIKQKTKYTCGVATVLSVLRLNKIAGLSEKRLEIAMHTTPDDGTDYNHMIEVAKKYKIKAELKTGLKLSDIEAGIKLGYVFIVDYQAWRPKKERHRSWKEVWTHGHYSIVQGIDEKNIWLMDPWLGEIVKWSHARFQKRWHDKYQDKKNYGTAIVFKGIG